MAYQNSLQRLTPFFAVVTLPVGILTGLFVGFQAAIAVLVVGWLLLVPAAAVLFTPMGGSGEKVSQEVNELVQEEIKQSVRDTSEQSVDPIEALRQRYARGEIDEQELEEGLEALLKTEGVDAGDEAEIRQTVDRLDGGDSELLTEDS